MFYLGGLRLFSQAKSGEIALRDACHCDLQPCAYDAHIRNPKRASIAMPSKINPIRARRSITTTLFRIALGIVLLFDRLLADLGQVSAIPDSPQHCSYPILDPAHTTPLADIKASGFLQLVRCQSGNQPTLGITLLIIHHFPGEWKRGFEILTIDPAKRADEQHMLILSKLNALPVSRGQGVPQWCDPIPYARKYNVVAQDGNPK